MSLLLDTHAWVWRLLDPDRLSKAAAGAVADPGNVAFLSPVSTWETLLLARKGRLTLSPSPHEFVLAGLRRSGLSAIPVSHEIALRSESLEGFGSEDPADRFLVATAIEHDLTLVTADQAIHDYRGVDALW